MKRLFWTSSVSVGDDATATAASTPPPPRQRARHYGGAAIDRLPLSLLRENVCGFLTTPMDPLREDGFSTAVYQRELHGVASVCRRWWRLTQQMKRDAVSRVCCVELKTGNEREIARILRRASEAGSKAEQVQLVAGVSVVRDHSCLFQLYPTVDAALVLEMPWSRIFTGYRNVVRLDLSLVPAQSVEPLLDASSSSCPKIKALILPYAPLQSPPGTTVVVPLINAMERWFAASGGLESLAIPWRRHDYSHQPDDLVSAITRFCPQIQFIRGWHLDGRRGMVERLLEASAPVWKSFCETCTNLREFDWRVASLSEHSVAAFAATVKPLLHTMDIKKSATPFKSEVGELTVLQPMFAAVPNLKSFRFYWSERGVYVNVFSGRLTVDELISDMLRHCPLLETFNYTVYANVDDGAIVKRAGLLALAHARSVRDVFVTGVLLEGDDLFDLFTCLRGCGQYKTSFCLETCGTSHAAVARVLHHLSQLDPATISEVGSLRLDVIYPSNFFTRGFNEERRRGLIPQDELQSLVSLLNDRFATTNLRLEIVANRYDERTGGDAPRERNLLLLIGVKLRINYTDDTTEGEQPTTVGLRVHDRGALWLELT